MSTILVLVSDRQKATQIQSDLGSAGHASIITPNSDTLARAFARKPDLAIVDSLAFPVDSEPWHWLVPGQGAKTASIIVLTDEARLTQWDLNLDIDDFMVEPYRKQELLSRVRRLLKATNRLEASETIRHGDLSIDDSGYEVRVGGRKVDLTYREYQLLKYLAANPGKVVTRETLLNKVWGYDYFGGDRTFDVHVRRLRSKLEDSEHVFVDTVRNVGYRFRGQTGNTIGEYSSDARSRMT
ncbi:MAG: response regulator transcription factor [Dehalococcoidia bacterium]|nr:response regulator transcription factor [Dehalococcoidia bacterium]